MSDKPVLDVDDAYAISTPGARCAIGVRSTHYDSAGFGDKLADDITKALISESEIVEVNMYLAETNNAAHADDNALIVICEVG